MLKPRWLRQGRGRGGGGGWSVRVGWGAVMMEVSGEDGLSRPRDHGETRARGALPGSPQRARSPRKQATPVHSKGGDVFRWGEGRYSGRQKSPRFCSAAESPQAGESGEEPGGVARPAGRSAPNAQKSPHSGRCPVSQAAEVGKGAPRPNPQFSAPRNSHPERLCASAPVINYRTQGGICKPHITNSTGLK